MERSETLEPSIRPLTEADRSRLRDLARELVAYRETARRSTWIALSAGVLALWIVTLLASDTSVVWVTLTWLAIGALLALWMGRELNERAPCVSDATGRARRPTR